MVGDGGKGRFDEQFVISALLQHRSCAHRLHLSASSIRSARIRLTGPLRQRLSWTSYANVQLRAAAADFYQTATRSIYGGLNGLTSSFARHRLSLAVRKCARPVRAPHTRRNEIVNQSNFLRSAKLRFNTSKGFMKYLPAVE